MNIENPFGQRPQEELTSKDISGTVTPEELAARRAQRAALRPEEEAFIDAHIHEANEDGDRARLYERRHREDDEQQGIQWVPTKKQIEKRVLAEAAQEARDKMESEVGTLSQRYWDVFDECVRAVRRGEKIDTKFSDRIDEILDEKSDAWDRRSDTDKESYWQKLFEQALLDRKITRLDIFSVLNGNLPEGLILPSERW